ncbi:MAG: Gfo/Idh/MocA family oxidoreductase [Candidatus Solibacter usitatus]|nr:Gfo/Idh/MocA family oxidoreductase [Candidatus Solibacter usitatus]
MTRRAVLAGAPAVLAAQTRAQKLRVAFIGTGNRGSFLLKNGLDVADFEVVAVCDILPDRVDRAASAVAAKGGSAKTYTDFRRMLDEMKDIDAVVLATPDYTHRDFDLEILARGKHLYAEKPLALTVADAKDVVRAAQNAKGIFQAGFQLRHDPHRNAAMKWIKSGNAGAVLQCHGIRHGGDLPRDIPWYFDKTKCGDIVTDQGIHILDLFRWAAGKPPVRCYGDGGTTLFVNDPPGRTVMDHYSLIYEFEGGAQINFSHHYFDPPGFTGIQERVFLSEGAVDLIKAEFFPRKERRKVALDVPDAGRDSTYMSLAAFASNVINGARPLNDAQSALEATLVALMGTRAIYEKRVVTWAEITG